MVKTKTQTKTIVGVALAVITIGVLGFAAGMYYYGVSSPAGALNTSASTPLSGLLAATNSISSDTGNQEAVKLVDKGCINPCDINKLGTKKCTLIKDGENICADGDGCTFRLITKYDKQSTSNWLYVYQNDTGWITYSGGGGGTYGGIGIYNGNNSGAVLMRAYMDVPSNGVFDDYAGDGGENSADAVSLHMDKWSTSALPVRLVICD